MLCGKRDAPRDPHILCRMSMCRRAISIDFFEIVLPNPLLSVTVAGLEGLRPPSSETPFFCISGELATWPLVLLCNRAFGGFSVTLLRETIGNDCLRFEQVGTAASDVALDLTDRAAPPGRALPAEGGRSGNLVLRLGGVSVGKSGRSVGRTGARGRGPGELGRDAGPGFRPFTGGIRLADGERLMEGAVAR